MSIAVVMPVGPGADEVSRAHDTVASIRAWEPQVGEIVIVDDPVDRGLRVDGATTIPHPLPPGGLVGERIAAAKLAGFKHVRDETDAEIVMKIDTDSLVIAPFADRLRARLTDRRIGMIGSYKVTVNGRRRGFSDVRGAIIWGARREPHIRPHLARAFLHGYRFGEHVLGAAVAFPRWSLDRLAIDDPTRYSRSAIGSDALFGILVRSAGLRPSSMGEDDPFGVIWQGLPDTPQRCLERGFAVVHSTKNDELPEAELRAWFAERRPRGDGA